MGACDITQDGGHIDRHLGFYPKLEIIKKRRKLPVFDVKHAKYDIIKHFASFCQHSVLLSLKKVKNTLFAQKWLDNLLLMRSYLVTIVTDSQ